jgi:hypothetical protein
MKVLPLVITGIAGLAAGALVGHNVHTTESKIEGQPTATASDDRPTGVGPAILTQDDNSRIVHLFTALKEPRKLKQSAELFEALRDCTPNDLLVLVERTDRLPYTTRFDLLPVLFERWFQLDSAAARDWVRAHPNRYGGVEAWANANPESAIQEAVAAPDAPYATYLVSRAIMQLAPNDPAMQLARLSAIPPGKLRDDVFNSLIEVWAEKDPAMAYGALGQMSPGRERDSARDKVLTKWAARDPAAALAQVNAILPTLKAGVLGNELTTKIAGQIGSKDPHLALDWI